MIFLKISSQSESVITEIALLLCRNRLVIDMIIKRNLERLVYLDDGLESQSITLITSTTKARLFDSIDSFIRRSFPDETLKIFSLPIVHMDWENANHLNNDITEGLDFVS